VQTDTKDRYEAQVQLLYRVAQARHPVADLNDQQIFIEDFYAFAQAFTAEGGCPNTVRGYKSALAYHCRSIRMPLSEAIHDELDTFLDGLTYQAGKGCSKPRGAITFDKLKQIMERVPQKERRLGQGIMLAWLGMLRTTEVAKVEVRDVNLEGKVVTVAVPDPKADCASKRIPVQLRSIEAARALLEELVKNREPEEPVIPEWDPKRVNAIIQRTAKECKWRKEFVWDGAHCFRHGRAKELEATDTSEVAWMRQGGWLSAKALRNTYRLEPKVMINREKSSKKKTKKGKAKTGKRKG
jgi:integrase